MDTPIPTPTATTTSESLPVNDSPVFSYISKLSPIKPVKAAPVAQGFRGINSPPLVFTSPHINPHRQQNFLKRPQFRQSSSAELQDVTTDTDESGKSNTQLSSGLDPCLEKRRGGNGSAHDQTDSPSGCVDEYFADLLEVDCADANLSRKQSDNTPQSLNGLMASKESVAALDKNNDIRDDVVVTLAASPAILEKAEEGCHAQASSDVNLVEIDGKQRESDVPISLCPNVEFDLSVGHAFDEQHNEQSVTKNAEAGNKLEWACTSHLLPEPMQISQAYEDCGETAGAVSSEPVGSMMLDDSMVSQRQCGMRRRCLQFEDAEQKSIANSPSSWNPSNSAGCSRSPATPADSEVLESSCVDIPATPSNWQLSNMTQPIFSTFSPQNNGNSSLTVSKPSGIGLHLNSIVNAMHVDSGASASIKSVETGYSSVRGKKLVTIRSCHISENIQNCSISSVDEIASARSEDGRQESLALIVASSAISQTPHSAKSLNNTLSLKKTIEQRATTYDEGRSNSENADGVEEFNRSSPRKKRKKTSGSSDGDGCKRCNCKKTKCLKLYCDCFAAGIYCDEPCSCQGCFNRPEYEDTVLDTRQQIEARNPLAFAPKIVQRITEPPANTSGEDGHRLTPFSARHKRGCNCKKSMCLKKYCECYQANVGCSEGCRCEGCKNVYGRKGECGMRKDIVCKEAIDERLEDSSDEKLETIASRNDFFHTKRCNPHNLTPLTPSFECSDHGKDASKARLPYGRYLPSPESDLTLLASYGKSPISSRNYDSHGMILETGKEILDIVTFDQELDCGSAAGVDKFSPRCHGLDNKGPHTAQPNPPSMAMASLTSPKTMDWTNGSRAQLCYGSDRFSSASSLRWRSSPITPMTLFGETKISQVLDSDDGLYDITEDDTPEILKDDPTPLNAVKVSSPNKKRVSPPHSRLHELGSSSSTGFRSGRKFILQAVPSFPPLIPCIDSKDSTGLSTDGPQDCSRSK